RVDGTTLFGNQGNYARICVEVDLHKPLLSKYWLRHRVRRIEYEGLHEICFTCGRYGHEAKDCPSTKMAEPAPSQTMENSFDNPIFRELDAKPEIEEDFGLWMKAKKHVRRKRSAPKVAPSVEGKEVGGSRFSPIREEVPSQADERPTVVVDTTAKVVKTVNPPSDPTKVANEVGDVVISTPEDSGSVLKASAVEPVQKGSDEAVSSVSLEVFYKQNSEA
ncbi:hypothetical protein LINPERHAP2_LOCUS12202, partial [Linum perenne]